MSREAREIRALSERVARKLGWKPKVETMLLTVEEAIADQSTNWGKRSRAEKGRGWVSPDGQLWPGQCPPFAQDWNLAAICWHSLPAPVLVQDSKRLAGCTPDRHSENPSMYHAPSAPAAICMAFLGEGGGEEIPPAPEAPH